MGTTITHRLLDAWRSENDSRASCGQPILRRKDLADAAGVTEGAVSQWFKGGNIACENCIAIGPLLGVNGKWLFDGKGQRTTINTAGAFVAANDDENAGHTISEYDASGSMGSGLILRDQSGSIKTWRVSHDWVSKNVKSYSSIDNLCIVTGFGDSMRPMFNSGDPLLLDSGVKSVEFDAIYFFRVGDEGFIKRLQRIPGDGIRAISENKSYESWTIREDMDFEIFGQVLKAWRSEDF